MGEEMQVWVVECEHGCIQTVSIYRPNDYDKLRDKEPYQMPRQAALDRIEHCDECEEDRMECGDYDDEDEEFEYEDDLSTPPQPAKGEEEKSTPGGAR